MGKQMGANFAQTYILYTSTGGEYKILGFGLVQVNFELFLGHLLGEIAILRKIGNDCLVLTQLYRINIFQ